jgi:hypothetical protein
MANKKVFTNLEFKGNSELINPRLNPGSAPASTGLGQAYFDTGTGGTLNLQFAAAGATNAWKAVHTSGVPFSTDQVFTSTLATGGVAPLVIASTTKVANLNADLLDGYTTSTTAVASTIPIYGTGGVLPVGDPTSPNHAAPRKYVDNAVQGLDHKESVRVATTADVDIDGDVNAISATDTIDGVTLVEGDRLLVKSQSGGGGNGIYTVTADGAVPTLAGDSGYGANIGGNTSSWTLGPTNVVLSGEVVTFTEAGSTAGRLTKTSAFEATSDLYYITFTIGTAQASIWIGNAALSGIPYTPSSETNTYGYVTRATGTHTVALPRRVAGTSIGINFHPAYGATSSTITDIQIRKADLQDGAFVFVEEGTANANSSWVLQGDGATWTQFSGAGQLTVNSNGAVAAPLTKSGDTINFRYSLDNALSTTSAVDIFSTYNFTNWGVNSSNVTLVDGNTVTTTAGSDWWRKSSMLTAGKKYTIRVVGTKTANIDLYIRNYGGSASGLSTITGTTFDSTQTFIAADTGIMFQRGAGAAVTFDFTTLTVVEADALSVKSGGIDTVHLANDAVEPAKLLETGAFTMGGLTVNGATTVSGSQFKVIGADLHASSFATTASAAKVRFETSAQSSLSSYEGTIGARWYKQIANYAGTASYPMLLNPYGGDVGIGTKDVSPSGTLHVSTARYGSDLLASHNGNAEAWTSSTPTGWTGTQWAPSGNTGNSTVNHTQETTIKHGGSNALRLHTTHFIGEPLYAGPTGTFTLTAGKTYKYSAWVRYTATSSVSLNIYSSGGVQLAYTNVTPTVNTWTEITGTYTVDHIGSTYGNIALVVKSQTSNGQYLYVDDFTIIEDSLKSGVHADGDDLVVSGHGSTGLSIIGQATQQQGLIFGDGSNNNYSRITSSRDGNADSNIYLKASDNDSLNTVMTLYGVDKSVKIEGNLGVGMAADGVISGKTAADSEPAIQMFSHDSKTIFQVRDASNSCLVKLYDNAGGNVSQKVELHTNGTSYFNGGNVAIGGTTALGPFGEWGWTPLLQQLGTQGIVSVRASGDVYGGAIHLASARGSNASPTIILDNDRVGGVYFHAHDGGDFSTTPGAIECFIDGTPGVNDTPGRLGFFTASDGSNSITERLRISSDGTQDHKGNRIVNSSTIQGLQDSACYDFDGTSGNFLLTSDGSDAFANQTFTVSGWVNLPDATPSDDNTIFSYDHTSHTPPHYGTHMRVLTSGKLFFAWNNGSTWQGLETAAQVFTDNTWHHFACTFKSGKQVIYIDGVEIASSTRTDTITFYAQEVWIGRAGYGTSDARWSGKMRSIQYFPSYLEPADVRKLYSGENPKKNNNVEKFISGGNHIGDFDVVGDVNAFSAASGGILAHSSGRLKITGASGDGTYGATSPAITTVANKSYLLKFDWESTGSWTVRSSHLSGGNHDYASASNSSGSGTFSVVFTPANTTSYVTFYETSADRILYLDNISLTEVGTLVDFTPRSASTTKWGNEAIPALYHGTLQGGVTLSAGNSYWNNIKQTGSDVGIGTDPHLSPTLWLPTADTLSVVGDSLAGSVEIGHSESTSNVIFGALKFVNTANSDAASATQRFVAGMYSRCITSDSNAGFDSGGSLHFVTKPEAGTMLDALTLDASANTKVHGKLGVGGDPGTPRLLVTDTSDARVIIHETGTTPYTATLELSSQGTAGSATYGALVQYTSGAERLTLQNYGRSVSAASAAGSIAFKTKLNNTTPTEVMFIQGFTGNVGIGTSLPGVNLDIQDAGNDSTIRLLLTAGTTTGTLGTILFGNTDVDNTLAKIQSSQDGATDSANLRFWTEEAGGSIAERLRIKSDGTQDHYGNATVNSASIQGLQDGACYACNLNSGTGGTGHIRLTGSGGAGLNTWAGATTIAMWIKPNGTPSDWDGLYSNSITTAGTSFGFAAAGVLRIASDGGHPQVTSTTAVTANEWNHVVASYSGSAITFYINGVEAGGGGSYTPNGSTDATHTTDFAIGQYYGGVHQAQYKFDGEIRQLQHFPSALTAPDVRKLYSGENPKKNLNVELVSAWANHGTYTYDTFTSSGVNITRALKSTSSGADIASSAITTTDGNYYAISFTCTLASGTLPTVYVGATNIVASGAVAQRAVAGEQTIVFKADSTSDYILFRMESTETTDYAISNFSLTEVGTLVDFSPRSASSTKWYNQAIPSLYNGSLEGGVTLSQGNTYWNNIKQVGSDVTFSGAIKLATAPTSTVNTAVPVLFQTADKTISGDTALTWNPAADTLYVNGTVITANNIRSTGTNSMKLGSANGGVGLEINSSGDTKVTNNLGVGTAPAAAGAGPNLDVRSATASVNIQSTTLTNRAYISIVNKATDDFLYFGKNGATHSLITGSTANAGIVGMWGNTDPLQFATNDAVALTIDGTQKIGIGTFTPVSLLDLTGVEAAANNTNPTNQFISFSVPNGVATNTSFIEGSGIRWAGKYTGYTKASAEIRCIGTGSFFRGGLGFYTNNATDLTTASALQLFLKSDGTQDHQANRIVNSQTVSDLHRTAEPSLRFDGSDDYVDVGSTTNYGPKATISAWVKFDRLAALYGKREGIVGSQYWADSNFSLHLHDTTQGLFFTAGVGDYSRWTITERIVVDQWHHLCLVYDSTEATNGDRAKLYIDGVFEAANLTGGTFPADLETNTGLQIGKVQNSHAGEIKDVRIHNRALEDTEVAAAYNGESTPWKYADAGEKLLNGTAWTGATGATPPNSWLVWYQTNTFTIDSAGGSGAEPALRINRSVSDNPYCYQTFAVVIGKTYRVRYKAKNGTATSARVALGSTLIGNEYSIIDYYATSWASYDQTFTATTALFSVYTQVITTTGTQYAYFDSLSVALEGEVAAYTPQSINDKWYDTTSNANHGTIDGATSVNRPDSYLGDLSVTSDTPIIQLRSTDTTAAADQSLGAIQFYSADTDGTPGVKAEIQGVAKDAHPDGRLSFKTASGGNAPVEHFRIGADGEVQAGNKDTDALIQVARVWAETITTNATDKYYRITHNLGSRRVVVSAAQEIGTSDWRSVEVAHRAGDWLNAASGNALSLVANGSLPNYTIIEFASAPGVLDFDITVIG